MRIKTKLEIIGKESASIVFEDFSIIMQSFKNSSYAKYSSGAGDYIQVCYHLLFSGIIIELINENILPPVPINNSERFGIYITLGSFFD